MSVLDAEELFHLGLNAIQSGDHEKAILSLKESIEIEPSARAIYVLGAEYAEIGMYSRAMEQLKMAVNIEPTLWMAHFQLGLLMMAHEGVMSAERAWANLDELGDDHYLVLFKNGLLQIEHGDIQTGIVLLRAGIAANTIHVTLNADIERVIESTSIENSAVETKNEGETVIAPQPDESRGDTAASHLFLSAYKGGKKN